MPPRFDRAVATRDLEVCAALLREGSKSFHAASLLLPPRLRAPAAAIYAFCRVADDAVDDSLTPAADLARLHDRVEAALSGRPGDDPVDRALAAVSSVYGLPLAPFDALLEGFAWDVEGRRYRTLSELRAYCVRVASTVGVMMTVLMGRRDVRTLWRACDLGVAMQLTNIARDVGEDARQGRVYLPVDWLEGLGLDADAWLADPTFRPEIGLVVRRLLAEADRLYLRADPGVRQLPWDCRSSIRAARLIYADIHRSIVRSGYDTVSTRAFTTRARKAWLALQAAPSLVAPPAPPSPAPPVPEARFLVDAVAREPVAPAAAPSGAPDDAAAPVPFPAA